MPTYDLSEYGQLRDIPQMIRNTGTPYTFGARPAAPDANMTALSGYQRLLNALRLLAYSRMLAPAGAAMTLGGDQGPTAFSGANYRRYLQMMGQDQPQNLPPGAVPETLPYMQSTNPTTSPSGAYPNYPGVNRDVTELMK